MYLKAEEAAWLSSSLDRQRVCVFVHVHKVEDFDPCAINTMLVLIQECEQSP